MEYSKPNLFNYATSELSQDAFIAWLLSWADPKCKNELLFDLSNAVLQKFFELCGKSIPEIKGIEVKRQYHNIDVYVEITTTKDDKWGIVIEDKIYTKSHSDQLENYRDEIVDQKNEISKNNFVGIYYKMHEQSELKKVNDSVYYKHFDRDTMITLLSEHEESLENYLVNDYKLHLEHIKDSLKAYKDKKVSNWKSKRYRWVGLYSDLQEELEKGNYSHVSNASGGFWAFWLSFQLIGGDDHIYLQIEEDKFCFKVQAKEDGEKGDAKRFWHKKILEVADNQNLDVIKPAVMRKGKTSTVGILDPGEKETWIPTNDDGKINLDKTKGILRESIRVIEIAGEIEPDYKN